MLAFFLFLAVFSLQSILALNAKHPISIRSTKELLVTRSSDCTATIKGTTLNGVETSAGACRYSLKYAQVAERWGYSKPASSVSNQRVAELPPACPQDSNYAVDGHPQNEDCLYAVVYTPRTTFQSGLPVFVWVHGGSFYRGSASSPGLDASNLAVKGDLIVVVLQYRLGILGFLPPAVSPASSDPNLGILDLINGLKAIHTYVDAFGGSKHRMTIGGQSSGAGMIRSLLGAPSARKLFRAIILQSDPLTYSLSYPALTNQLRDALYSSAALFNCTDLACLQKVPLSDLIVAQTDLISRAPYAIPGVPMAEVIRPTAQTTTIPYDPTSLLFTDPEYLEYRPVNLPLLITTTKNEAGSVIQQLFPTPIDATNSTFYSSLATLLGQSRADTIAKTAVYTLNNGQDSLRETLEKLATDGIWRCPARAVANNWVLSGGKVWVGEWREGATYPDNQAGGYCTTEGRVCHEDDIYEVFGTTPSASGAVSTFEDGIMSRWISFITTHNPNPGSCSYQNRTLPRWPQYRTQQDVFPLGGDGKVNSCPSIWGGTVPYDWQIYGPKRKTQ